MLDVVVMFGCRACMLCARVVAGTDAVPEENPEDLGDQECDAVDAYASEGKFHQTWFWSCCA